MIGWLAALTAARWLAIFVARHATAESGKATRAHAVPVRGADWLARSPMTWAEDGPARNAAGKVSSSAAAGQEAALRFAWLWCMCGAAGECAIYGGMAAGNEAGGPVAIWPLAVGVVIAVATAELLGACMAVALAVGPVERSGRAAAILRLTGRLLGLPAGVRGSMALLGFAVAGADGAFFAVLAVSGLPVAITVAMLGKIAPAERKPAALSRAAARSSDSARMPAIWARSAKTGGAPPASVPRRKPWPAPLSSITIIGGPGPQGGSDAVHVTAATRGGDQVGETAGPGGAAHPAGAGDPAGLKATARVRGTAGPGHGGRTSGTAGPGHGGRISGPATHGPMTYASGATDPSGTTGGATGGTTGQTRARHAAEDAASRNEAKPRGAPSGAVNTPAAAPDALLALRDDGAVARWAGRLVQGNLIPLPPALAGLVATSMLAALGVRNLAGFIVLTPPVVMMLAAPGSSHPHDRRFDWLVPVLLELAQYVYLAPLGLALALPGPVIFSACALIFIWYTGVRLTATTGFGRGTSIGWETRMFTIGLATTFGLATFGYVGLATYLGVLICRKIRTGYLVPREEDRQ